MTRDFTLQMYHNLMETVTASVYIPTTVCDYLTSPPARAMILRHDVDRAPGRAVEMARVEEEMGVRGSYYFRRGASKDRKMIKHSASHLNILTIIQDT